MDYQKAKDIYDELVKFEGEAKLPGNSDAYIDIFVLLPKNQAENIDIKEFMDVHTASGSFEIEGEHEGEEYALLGINLKTAEYTDDLDYFMKLLVW